MIGATSQRRTAADTRSRVYWLLADFFRARPDPEFLARLAAPPQDDEAGRDVTAPALAQLRAMLVEDTPEAMAERLAPEYTRLLGGLKRGYGPPPPFESLYREAARPGAAIPTVMGAYLDAGFGVVDEALGPQDHVSAELKFMALACYRESEAWAQGATQEAIVWLERQRAFLDRHLLAWLPALCDALRAAAREPYFRHVADLAEAACRADREDLEDRLARADLGRHPGGA